MHEYQFLNFDDPKNWDRPIYRIMEQEHVFALFQDKKNAMIKFSNWKDNFENFLMNCGHEINGQKYDNTVREKMVAQCWTKERYSDAMWSIYANRREERFLRIKSTPRKLLRALILSKPWISNELCRVGQIEYKPTSEIRAYYDEKKGLKVTQKLLFESLLLKRMAFSHEREVRLIYCALFDGLDDNGLFLV